MATAALTSEQIGFDKLFATRIYHVSDLDFASKGEDALLDATKANGLPPLGQPHKLNTEIYAGHARVYEVNYLDNSAMVRVDYSVLRPDESIPFVAFGQTVELVDTQRDVDGKPMLIDWSPYVDAGRTGLVSCGDSPDGAGCPVTFMGQAKVPVNRLTMTLRKPVKDVAAVESLLSLVGTLNSDNWITPLNASELSRKCKPDTWLCTQCVTDEQTKWSLGTRWGPFQVFMEFAFNPSTWNPVVTLLNPQTRAPFANTGKIPIIDPANSGLSRHPQPGAADSEANGIKVFRVSRNVSWRSKRLFEGSQPANGRVAR